MTYREKQYNTMLLKVEDHVATVQFNRPEVRNAVNAEMIAERLEIFKGVAADPDVRVVILTGGEEFYCAGGDLGLFRGFGVKEARDWADRVVDGIRLLAELPKPTIAAIAGYAFGGGLENALACDLRIATEDALFCQPEINVGIFPGGSGTQRLPQNISLCKAKELVFFGKPIDAKTALEIGLINRVVSKGQLLESAQEWAKKLAKKPPFALRMAKMALNAAWNNDVETGMKLETNAWAMTFGTEDQKEGMNAFLEKRKPEYTGR